MIDAGGTLLQITPLVSLDGWRKDQCAGLGGGEGGAGGGWDGASYDVTMSPHSFYF